MSDLIVETTTGKLRGLIEHGITIFRGIPYGAPVGGGHRFQAPTPPQPWNGVRDAFAFGDTAPQVKRAEPGEDLPLRFAPTNAVVATEAAKSIAQSENCLMLNVWTPKTGAGNRPVMVYLHGGGYYGGSASARHLDGTNLALLGDAVVVSMNHRLDVLGYLYLAELGDERFRESGNAGTLDLVLALRWVRDNISQFGGDPGNVTVFGGSGGSAKLTTLLAMPEATCLFRRAICQSGADALIRTPSESTESAKRLLGILDISMNHPELLLDVPIERLLDAVTALHPPGSAEHDFWPVNDGTVLFDHPVNAIASGSAADVALIIGTMATETSVLLAYNKSTKTVHHNGLFEKLPLLFGDATAQLLETYRHTRPNASETELFVAMTTDRIRIPSIRIAEAKIAGGGRPVYMYENTFLHPFEQGVYGSPHGLDRAMAFDNCHARAFLAESEGAKSVARKIAQVWTSFARSGLPNSAHTPLWPPYSLDQRATMFIDEEWHVVDDPNAIEREAWKTVDLSGAGLVSRTVLTGTPS